MLAALMGRPCLWRDARRARVHARAGHLHAGIICYWRLLRGMRTELKSGFADRMLNVKASSEHP